MILQVFAACQQLQWLNAPQKSLSLPIKPTNLLVLNSSTCNNSLFFFFLHDLLEEPANMTNGMSGADISSLLYVKSNTFKIERKKEKLKNKQKKKLLHLQHFCTSNKVNTVKLRWQPTVYHTC